MRSSPASGNAAGREGDLQADDQTGGLQQRSTATAELRDPRSWGRPRVEVGPAFAHGCHDLGDLGVESVKLLSFGSARDEGVSIAGCARAPYPLDRACCGDVRQRVTRHEDQV